MVKYLGVKGHDPWCTWACAKLLQFCPALCYPMNRSPPAFSVHGTFQARKPDRVPMPSSRGSSQHRNQTLISGISCISRQVLYHFTSLVAQMVKSLPAVQETRVQSLGQEDPLEKQMATHSTILAWRIPWMEEPGRVQSMGLQGVGHH